MWVNDPAPAITASTVTGSASATASRRRPALTGRPAVPAVPDGRPRPGPALRRYHCPGTAGPPRRTPGPSRLIASLNARPPCRQQRGRCSPLPGRGGTPLVYRNRVREALFHFPPRNQVPEGQGCPPVTGGSMHLACTFCLPGVDLRCTRDAISAGPARARGRGAPVVLRTDAVPALAGETTLAVLVPGGQASCRCRVLARERCPASAPSATFSSHGSRQSPSRRGDRRQPRSGDPGPPCGRQVSVP